MIIIEYFMIIIDVNFFDFGVIILILMEILFIVVFKLGSDDFNC